MTAVTIEEAKRHLRITTNTDDERIEEKLAAAEDYVFAFIGGDQIGPDGRTAPAIREAILQQLAFYHDGTPVDLGAALAPYRTWVS